MSKRTSGDGDTDKSVFREEGHDHDLRSGRPWAVNVIFEEYSRVVVRIKFCYWSAVCRSIQLRNKFAKQAISRLNRIKR